MSSPEAMEPFATPDLAAPGLRFDSETAGALDAQVSQLEERVGELRRQLSEGEPCGAVQASVLELRTEVTALTVRILKAHMETCIAQCVQAGEGSAALASLRTALERLLQHL